MQIISSLVGFSVLSAEMHAKIFSMQMAFYQGTILEWERAVEFPSWLATHSGFLVRKTRHRIDSISQETPRGLSYWGLTRYRYALTEFPSDSYE